MMRAGVVAAIATLALACGGATRPSEQGAPPDGGADAEAGADDAFTIRDGAKCCAAGTGRSCCAPDESFLKCAPYAGAFDHCSGAGEPFAAKMPCALCCPGTDRIRITKVAPDGSCTISSEDSLVCAPCGDGVCDPAAGENRCSCPEDCPAR
jgi:hypothetical protein